MGVRPNDFKSDDWHFEWSASHVETYLMGVDHYNNPEGAPNIRPLQPADGEIDVHEGFTKSSMIRGLLTVMDSYKILSERGLDITLHGLYMKGYEQAFTPKWNMTIERVRPNPFNFGNSLAVELANPKKRWNIKLSRLMMGVPLDRAFDEAGNLRPKVETA